MSSRVMRRVCAARWPSKGSNIGGETEMWSDNR